jgi:hypothetical protein
LSNLKRVSDNHPAFSLTLRVSERRETGLGILKPALLRNMLKQRMNAETSSTAEQLALTKKFRYLGSNCRI